MKIVLLMLVCIATFVGVIVAFKPAAVSESIAAREPSLVLAQPFPAPGTAPSPVMSPVSRIEERPRLANAAPAPIEVSPLPAQVPPNAPEASQLPPEATGADEANERATAIRNLDSSAPGAVQELERAVRYDGTSRNRLLAVNALRLMAKRGDERERAVGLLQIAMSDSDANVASSARDAYAELQP